MFQSTRTKSHCCDVHGAGPLAWAGAATSATGAIASTPRVSVFQCLSLFSMIRQPHNVPQDHRIRLSPLLFWPASLSAVRHLLGSMALRTEPSPFQSSNALAPV